MKGRVVYINHTDRVSQSDSRPKVTRHVGWNAVCCLTSVVCSLYITSTFFFSPAGYFGGTKVVIVDESRTETADRVARYQADYQGGPAYATRKLLRLYTYLDGALCFGLPVIFPWFLVLLCLQVVVFLSPFLLQVVLFKGPPHSLRGDTIVFFYFSVLFLFFSSDLSSSFLFFHVFCLFVYFVEYVCRVCRMSYPVS